MTSLRQPVGVWHEIVIQARGDTSCLSMDSIFSLAFYVWTFYVFCPSPAVNKTVVHIAFKCIAWSSCLCLVHSRACRGEHGPTSVSATAVKVVPFPQTLVHYLLQVFRRLRQLNESWTASQAHNPTGSVSNNCSTIDIAKHHVLEYRRCCETSVHCSS